MAFVKEINVINYSILLKTCSWL